MNFRHTRTTTDAETGEILSNVTWIERSDFIIFGKYGIYSKNFYNRIPKFDKMSYYGYWYLLSNALEFQSNRVVKNIEGDFIPMGKAEIMGLLGIKKTTYYEFTNLCVENKYIYIAEDVDEMYLNPVYELNGSKIPIQTYLYFRGSLIEHYISVSARRLINEYIKKHELDVDCLDAGTSELSKKVMSVIELDIARPKSKGILSGITNNDATEPKKGLLDGVELNLSDDIYDSCTESET